MHLGKTTFPPFYTHSNFLEGPGHHGDKHVEENDHRRPVINAKDDVANTLSKSALEALSYLYHARLGESKQRPVHRAKGVLKPARDMAASCN